MLIAAGPAVCRLSSGSFSPQMVINFRRDENPVVAQATPLVSGPSFILQLSDVSIDVSCHWQPLIEEVDEDDLLNLESALPAGQQVQRLRRRLSALVIVRRVVFFYLHA